MQRHGNLSTFLKLQTVTALQAAVGSRIDTDIKYSCRRHLSSTTGLTDIRLFFTKKTLLVVFFLTIQLKTLI